MIAGHLLKMNCEFSILKIKSEINPLDMGVSLFGNHGILYIILNLPKLAIWRSKIFRIRPSIAEKSTTLLFSGTFGHTVVLSDRRCRSCLKNITHVKYDSLAQIMALDRRK